MYALVLHPERMTWYQLFEHERNTQLFVGFMGFVGYLSPVYTIWISVLHSCVHIYTKSANGLLENLLLSLQMKFTMWQDASTANVKCMFRRRCQDTLSHTLIVYIYVCPMY